MQKKGLFITLEGGEGVGKSTNMAFVGDFLRTNNVDFIETREPGGTALAESLRAILLAKQSEENWSEMAELLIIFAARAQHLQQVILPAIESGVTVLCDRFTDATYAYQGGGRDMGFEAIATLEQLVQQDLRPDLTILLDAPLEVGMQRARERSELDRFESEQLTFFQKVRNAYLARASQEPSRFAVVDASQTLAAVQTELKQVLSQRLFA